MFVAAAVAASDTVAVDVGVGVVVVIVLVHCWLFLLLLHVVALVFAVVPVLLPVLVPLPAAVVCSLGRDVNERMHRCCPQPTRIDGGLFPMEYRVHVLFVPRRPHGLMVGWGRGRGGAG